jgi:hypothetical protein
MDLADFDSRACARVDNLWPNGAYSQPPPLPKKMRSWKGKIGPLTKEPRELIMIDWQESQCKLILDSLQHETHDWALQTVKRREGPDKQDPQNRAHSLLSLDHHGRLRPEGRALSEMCQAPAGSASTNAIAAAAANSAIRPNVAHANCACGLSSAMDITGTARALVSLLSISNTC